MALYKLTEYRSEQILPTDVIKHAGPFGREKSVKIINAQYCKFMVTAGACTGVCKDCEAELKEVFTGMPSKVTSPWGLLTYRVRNARMRMIEKHADAAKTPTVSDVRNFGEEQVSGLDALDAML